MDNEKELITSSSGTTFVLTESAKEELAGITVEGNEDISTLSEYDVTSKATARISEAERAKIIPANIAQGVTILGVPGAHSGSGSGPTIDSRTVYYTEDWTNPEASTELHQATLTANSYYKYDPDAGSGLDSPFIQESPAGLTESGIYLYDKDEGYVIKIYDDLDIFSSIDLLYTSGSNSDLNLINLSDLEIGQSTTYVPDQGGHESFTITRTA